MASAPDAKRDAADADMSRQIADLAEAIRAFQRQMLDEEYRALRRASRIMEQYAYQPSVTSLTLPPRGSYCRLVTVVAQCQNATITLQLKGGLNVPTYAMTLPVGVSNLFFGGSELEGLTLQPDDVVQLSTTGSAGVMSLAIIGERLPSGLAY